MHYFITPDICCQVIHSPRLKIVFPQAFALQELNFVLLDNCVNQEESLKVRSLHWLEMLGTSYLVTHHHIQKCQDTAVKAS